MVFNKYLCVFLALGFSFMTQLGRAQETFVDSVLAIPYSEYVSDYPVYSPLFNQALTIAEQEKDSVSMATILMRQNILEYLAGEVDYAIQLALRSIDINTSIGNEKGLSRALCLLGYQIKRQDLDRAIDYMRQGIRIQENLSDTLELLNSYDNYSVLKEFNGELDSALYFVNLSLTFKRLKHDTNGIPFSLNKIANLHLLKGHHALALQYMDTSSTMRAKDSVNFYYLGENEMCFGEIYADWGKTFRAIEHYEKAIFYAQQKSGYAYLIRDAAQRLTKLYASESKFDKAYKYSAMYQLFNDSIESASTRKNMNTLLVRYESAEKEKTIAKQAFLLTEETLKSRNRQILAISIAFLLALVVLYFIYRIRISRQRRMQAEEAGQLKLQNERIRVSRDLHDHIGAELTLIASATDQQARQITDKGIVSELKNISQNARLAMQQLRETIWAISPEPIVLNAFALRLQTYAQKMCQSHDIQLVFENNLELTKVQLSPAITINLYRVCQESINNVCKHSGATRVRIECSFQNQILKIQIQDNGKGFDANNIQAGYGLQNMEGRMADINGQIRWDSTLGKGTNVLMEINVSQE
jgi:signal transduction histidine kinase